MTYNFFESLMEATGYGNENSAALLLDSDPFVYKLNEDQRSECITGALRCGLEVDPLLLDVLTLEGMHSNQVSLWFGKLK